MRKLIYTGCLGLLMLGSIGMSAQVVVAQEESQLTEEQQLRQEKKLQLHRHLLHLQEDLHARQRGMEMAQRHLAEQQAQLQQREQQYQELAERAAAQMLIPKEELKQQVADLFRQRAELKIEMAGLKSAEEHLVKMREQSLHQRHQAYLHEMEIAKKIAEQRTKSLDYARALKERGAGTEKAIREAETEVLQAQAEVERLTREATVEGQTPFSEAVFENSIRLARISAQLKALEAEVREIQEQQMRHDSLLDVRKRAIQQYLEKAYVEQMEAEDQLKDAEFDMQQGEREIRQLEQETEETEIER